MAVVTVNEDVCKGCGLCVGACPKHIMELDTSHLSNCKEMDSCIGCAFCSTMCPDVAITVEK